jgi:predicted transcriptional regulator
MTDTDSTPNLVELTADIVAAYVGANKISLTEVGSLITSIHAALAGTTAPAVPDAAPQEPAVSIRSSIKHDYIVCLEDGAKLKMLKRYLRTRYAMSPDDYRAKWGLPRDYPMVAPAYAETRRGLANAIGLGRKKQVEEESSAPATKKKPSPKPAASETKKRGRPAKQAAPAEPAPASETGDSTEG